MGKPTIDAWRKVVDLLDEGNLALRARIELAIDDPPRYVKKYARELRSRGVSTPIPTLAFVALLDGLDAAKRVALIDWKETAEDVEHLLKATKPRPTLDFRWMRAFDEDALDDVSTERVLRAVAANAGPKTVLLNLDTGSDQYAIVLVDEGRARRIVAAMKAVGHPAVLVPAKALPTPKKKRAAKSPPRGTPLASWPDCRNDASGTWRYFMNRTTLRNTYTSRYETAFDVREGPAWSTDTKTEKRTFETAAQCTKAYVSFYEGLQRDGWLQYTQAEHAKEVLANAAAKANGTLKKKRP